MVKQQSLFQIIRTYPTITYVESNLLDLSKERGIMIIDGKSIAQQVQEEIKLALHAPSQRRPCLSVILVGDHPPSRIYIGRKIKACQEVGIDSICLELPTHTTEGELIAEIEKLNINDAVDGILLQLPLPQHMNPIKIISCINPAKDVDGLHPYNVGKMYIGDSHTFFPCTPLGIKVLLERSDIEVAGKHVLILGRSNLVGKPMAAILMQNASGGNATVTVAHSRTRNLKDLTRLADILIVAIGQPEYVTADMVKEGAVVIDVGVNKIDSAQEPHGYKLVGDVDFANVKDKCSHITPVPGGVGPMTIAMLLSNTLKSYLNRFAS